MHHTSEHRRLLEDVRAVRSPPLNRLRFHEQLAEVAWLHFERRIAVADEERTRGGGEGVAVPRAPRSPLAGHDREILEGGGDALVRSTNFGTDGGLETKGTEVMNGLRHET